MNLVLRRACAALALAVAALAATACCGGSAKAFNDSFCKSYKDTFLQSQNQACLAKTPGKTAECNTAANAALAKDPTFTAKCNADGTGK